MQYRELGIFMNHQRRTGGFKTLIMPRTFCMWYVCCISLLYELGLVSGFEIHTSHYCVALSRCVASCVTLLHPQSALKQCQSKIRKNIPVP